jgi:hypothetical protein
MGLTAISVGNDAHFAKGGVKALTLGIFDDTLAFTVAATHEVTGMTHAALTAVIGFEKESAKMTISDTQEKGLSMTTVTLEGYLPKMDKDKFKALQELKGQALYGLVELWNGEQFLVGWDNILGDSTTTAITSDFALFLDSIEGESGAALADANGVTLKMTAVQGELPREVTLA